MSTPSLISLFKNMKASVLKFEKLDHLKARKLNIRLINTQIDNLAPFLPKGNALFQNNEFMFSIIKQRMILENYKIHKYITYADQIYETIQYNIILANQTYRELFKEQFRCEKGKINILYPLFIRYHCTLLYFKRCYHLILQLS